MALAEKAALGAGALGSFAGGVFRRSEFGTLVYLDRVASTFAGCFF